MRFVGKTCLVTGGGSGIGRAVCLRFSAEGGTSVVTDIDVDHAEETVRLITACGGKAAFVQGDVSDSADVQAAVNLAIDRFGKIDVLVNNAAIMTFTHIGDLCERDWDRVLAVNLKSVFLLCKFSIPHMPPGSAIINTSSVHAHSSEPGAAPYAASKAAMEAMSRVLAMELQAKKIRVNCVAPGAVDTPMLWNNPNVRRVEHMPAGAVGEPKDIAAAICFLASDEARFINGTTLTIDAARLDIL